MGCDSSWNCQLAVFIRSVFPFRLSVSLFFASFLLLAFHSFLSHSSHSLIMCGRAACSLAPATLLARTGATEWRQGSTSSTSTTKAPKAESDAPSCKSEPDTKAKDIKHEGDGLYAPALNLSQGSFVPVLSLESSPPARVITSMRWGLVGAGSEHPDAVHLRRPFNARSETVATKRCFKRLLLRRRCAVLAEAYYEFQKLSPKQQQQQAEDAEVAATTAKARQPYLFAPPDFAPTSNSSELDAKPAPLLYLAALYDVWTNAPKASKRGGREALQPHDSLATVTVLTIKAPTDDIRAVHNRMPLLLDAADGSLDCWLDCSRFSADAALTTVTQACVSRLTTSTDTGAASLRWFPVSPLANDPHCNDAAACLVPLDRKLAAIPMTNTAAPVEGLASEPPRAPKRKRDSEADGTDAPSPCALAATANDDDGSPHAKRAKHTHDTSDLPAAAAAAEVHFFDLPWSPASTQSSDDEADSDFDDYGYCSPCSSCQPSQESQEDADAPA